MSGDRMYDVAVVGRGLLGSSAARHLGDAGLSVCLVGPDEPLQSGDHTGVFGSHYDRARIARITDRDPFYSRIAAASIARYRDLENRSRKPFFSAVGHLVVTPVSEYLAAMQDHVHVHEVDGTRLTARALADRFPYLAWSNLGPGTQAIFERTTGGYIDPRAFIAAQSSLVEQSGGTITTATAQSVREHNSDVLRVHTDGDQGVLAKKVLVATGAFANHLDVLPRSVDIEIQEHTVVLAQVDDSTARELAAMPTVIYKSGDKVGESVYVVPPIVYPDGHSYIKIGQSTGHVMNDPGTRLQPWFRSDGDAEIAAWLIDELTTLLPIVEFTAVRSESCAVTTSPTNRPYIDRVGDTQIYTLLAGNGAAAKSADELGRIAAHYVKSGTVPAEYRNEDFGLRYI